MQPLTFIPIRASGTRPAGLTSADKPNPPTRSAPGSAGRASITLAANYFAIEVVAFVLSLVVLGALARSFGVHL